ncbi:MAG TPA: hypothetical protein VE110_11950 [Gemmatimonadaceae bacterium]|nr:hypothetical protein [Gemmatimonadaceae bacterium]
MIDAVEMTFERIEVGGPEPSERGQPLFHFLQWLRLQSVDTALCVYRGFHETGVTEHTQVLGHGRLGHPQLRLDLSYGPF